MAPKQFAFQKSFRTRCLLTILRWNNGPKWYQELEDEMKFEKLSAECQRVLDEDTRKKQELKKKYNDDLILNLID